MPTSQSSVPVTGNTEINYAEYKAPETPFKVALVHPFLPASQFKNRLKNRESLSLGYLAGALRRHDFRDLYINAEMLDLGPDEVSERVLSDPDVALLGLSLKSQRTYRAAKKIAASIKRERPEIHITVGGVFPSAANDLVLKDCADFDSLVRGEGETAIVELAARLLEDRSLSEMTGLTHRQGGEIVVNPSRPRVRDLDSLPFPARDDLEYILQHRADTGLSAYVVASRGCYARCTFCSIHALYDGSHLRVQRSAAHVVEEIEFLLRTYGIRRFQFVDDLFVMPSRRGRDWVRELRERIEEREISVELYGELRSDTVTDTVLSDLRRAGLSLIFIGADAGNDTVLERMQKGTTVAENDRALEEVRRQGIDLDNVVLGYIMFEPEMTLEELKDNYDWIRSSGYCNVQHLQNRMNIYHGTPQYHRMQEQGNLDVTKFGERWSYGFSDPRVSEFEACFRRFQDRFMAECHDLLVPAKVAWRLRSQKGVPISETAPVDSTRRLESWLADLFDQAYRRVESLERDSYYYVFDNLFVWLEERDSHPSWREEKLWNSLLPLIEQLKVESELFRKFADAVNGDLLKGGPDGSTPSPCAWLDDGELPTAYVCLRQNGKWMGYRAAVGVRRADRLDHSCEIVDFGAGTRWRHEAVVHPSITRKDLELLPEPVIGAQCC